MATTWPKNFPGVGTTAEKVAETITKASDGRLEIKVYGSGEIVPAYEVFDAVRQGTVEMGHGWPGYWISKNPGQIWKFNKKFELCDSCFLQL